MRKDMDKKEIGTFGEKVAEEYLINCGYKIVEKNFRCRFVLRMWM